MRLQAVWSWTAAACALLACGGPRAFGQARTMTQAGHRMEIMLERHEGGAWHTVDPELVLSQGDVVRFRFRTNFDGYLYVSNQSTSGKYEQLFPRVETGQENRIVAGQEYRVPATAAAFRIAGPPGHEIVYWLVSPARLGDVPPRLGFPAPESPPHTLIPRCDDEHLRARGDCVDTSAGPKLVPRDADLPQNLSDAAARGQRDLMFLRQEDTAVIASPDPLTGPVIYEFRLAHR